MPLAKSMSGFLHDVQDDKDFLVNCYIIYKTKRGVILYGKLLSPKNGGYLLSHKRSTIGAVGLNFSVRNGKRWNPDTITT